MNELKKESQMEQERRKPTSVITIEWYIEKDETKEKSNKNIYVSKYFEHVIKVDGELYFSSKQKPLIFLRGNSPLRKFEKWLFAQKKESCFSRFKTTVLRKIYCIRFHNKRNCNITSVQFSD